MTVKAAVGTEDILTITGALVDAGAIHDDRANYLELLFETEPGKAVAELGEEILAAEKGWKIPNLNAAEYLETLGITNPA